MTNLDPRPRSPQVAAERDQLAGFLDFLRATVVWKASGLTDEQARRSLVPSRLVTVAGLVWHLTLVEEWWFANVISGEPDRWQEASAADPDFNWRPGNTPLPELVAGYRAQCAVSRRHLAGRALEDVVAWPGTGEEFNVRWVLIHMVEETARHAGHLDLVRELTDGLTGE